MKDKLYKQLFDSKTDEFLLCFTLHMTLSRQLYENVEFLMNTYDRDKPNLCFVITWQRITCNFLIQSGISNNIPVINKLLFHAIVVILYRFLLLCL